MAFTEVCRVDDVPPGAMKRVIVKRKFVLLTNVAGQVYAIGGICTHWGGDLSEGVLDGKVVTCPWHGSQFDVTTGKNVRGPAEKDEPVYEVKIEGDSIFVEV